MSHAASITLVDLHETAIGSDAQNDWVLFYQHLAGMSLIVPLVGAAGDRIQPVIMDYMGEDTIEGFTTMDAFAASLTGPRDYAEIDGAHLAAMLDGQDTALLVRPDDQPVLLIEPVALSWIAEAYSAEVSQSERGEGVSVTAPELPPLPVMEMLGKTVGALGANCPEAWLVSMKGQEGQDELVLVMGLADDVRKLEGELAEAVTRAVQAVTDQRFAVACPDRGSALMATARQNGIGIGG